VSIVETCGADRGNLTAARASSILGEIGFGYAERRLAALDTNLALCARGAMAVIE